jgi:hypothetical protein
VNPRAQATPEAVMALATQVRAATVRRWLSIYAILKAFVVEFVVPALATDTFLAL